MVETLNSSKNGAIKSKMEALARFVVQMNDEEIWAFLEALFPSLDEEGKEDLFDLLIIEQRKNDPARPLDDFLKELSRETP